MNKNNQQALSPEKYIRTRARSLTIVDCYINANWRDSGLAMIFVCRRHINGHITHATYMVDIFCLGLKESFWTFNQHPLDFRDFMEKQHQANPYGVPLMKTSYALVHNIIYGAIEYAGELGFLPHKSFDITKYILEEDDDHVELIDLEFGYKGKPLYISSPERQAERNKILAHLDKNPGRGNYEYITEGDEAEFFDKEYEKEREQANYHDPEVKRGIIEDFISRAEGPFGSLVKDSGKLREIIELSDTIFYEYIVSEEELDKASETIQGLFDFSISDEWFSDEMLKGESKLPVSLDEIRLQADRLLDFISEGKTAEGIRQSRAMMDKYPGFPLFIYLHMRCLEQRDGMSKLLPKLQKYVIQYPDYLPLSYLYAASFILNKPEDVSRHIGASLHLRNFYPQRKTFSKEEVLQYMQVLTIDYGNSGEFALIEEMVSYIEDHFPGVMPAGHILTAKLLKIPFELDWCKKWMEGGAAG